MLSAKQKKKKLEEELFLNKQALPGKHEMIVVLDHLKSGYNIGKIFRSANVFGLAEVHVIGTTFFDPYPAKGALRKTPARFFSHFDESYAWLKEHGYAVYALGPDAANAVYDRPFAERSAFVIGSEEVGLTFNPDDYKMETISIPQFGVVQSLNASVAASIVMYEFIRRKYKV